jgi:hypothetical protein
MDSTASNPKQGRALVKRGCFLLSMVAKWPSLRSCVLQGRFDDNAKMLMAQRTGSAENRENSCVCGALLERYQITREMRFSMLRDPKFTMQPVCHLCNTHGEVLDLNAITLCKAHVVRVDVGHNGSLDQWPIGSGIPKPQWRG